ncbi:hypothetical protein CR513_47507, partial [Mucuna pruriens]
MDGCLTIVVGNWAKCMTRSKSSNSLHSFDPEIYKTMNRIRKTKNIHDIEGVGDIGCVVPAVVHPISAVGADLVVELKSKLIHLLRKFHGLAGEDPHKRLKEFHDKTIRDLGRLYINEGVSILS